MRISEILIYERINKNYARRYVVDESGVSEPTVAAYEYGKAIPQVYKLEDILNVYGLELLINGIKQEYSEYCKSRRTERGLSVHELSKLAGTKESTIKKIEAGNNIRLDLLMNIIEFFGDKLVIDGMVVSNEYGLLE